MSFFPEARSRKIDGRTLFKVAIAALAGEGLMAEGKTDLAIEQLRQAVAARRTPCRTWNRPNCSCTPATFSAPSWCEAGRPAEAEAVYREDLARHPHNGWSLFGLRQSLQAQKRTADAAKVEAEFKDAWKQADIKLTASYVGPQAEK